MTKNPVVWFQYLCWMIQAWMSRHEPIYPSWLRNWIYDHVPNAPLRWSVSHADVASWKRFNPQLDPMMKPLPWWAGIAALGIFYKPWRAIINILRKGTGGRSHRCEFTDPEHGALYGHKEGAFMDRCFDVLLQRIDAADNS